jgi:hypothetical protein
MGSYGYICPKCGKNVRAGELCVLRNVRHGIVIDEATGHYDEYGGVEESDSFDTGDAGTSFFNFDDSIWKYATHRIYNGEMIEWFWYYMGKMDEYNEQYKKVFKDIKEGKEDVQMPEYPDKEELLEEFRKLPKPDITLAKSGVSAYHKYCFDRLSEEEKTKNICSLSDPDQSWGAPRKKYM